MRRPLLCVLCCLWLVSTPRPVAALVVMGQSEEFGPAKATANKPTDPHHSIAYLPGRVYALHNSWSGFGSDRHEELLAFEGDAAALNAAIAEFMRLPAPAKEIQLLPGPGQFRSVKGNVTGRCDWRIQWTSCVTWPRDNNPAVETHTAVLTVYIARAENVGALDSRAAAWIKDLDHERFAERQRAFEQLAALGEAAAPLLRDELKRGESGRATSERRPSPESTARIGTLLRRLFPLHPAQLQLPTAAAILSVDDLLDRERRQWRSKDLAASWYAAEKIAVLAEHSERALPLLIEMLHDSREQVRELALKALEHLGPRAVGLLPTLRVERDKAQPACHRAFNQAIHLAAGSGAADSAPAGVEASADSDARGWRSNRQLRAGIRHWLACRRQDRGE